MITNFLLNGILTILTAPLALLPHEPSLGIATGASTLTSSSFFPHLGWANDFFPLSEAIAMIGIAAATFLVIYVIKLALWLWDTIKP